METPSAYDLAISSITRVAPDNARPQALLFDYADPQSARLKRPHAFRAVSYALDVGQRAEVPPVAADQVAFCLAGEMQVEQDGDSVTLRPWDALTLCADSTVRLCATGNSHALLLVMGGNPADYERKARKPTVQGPMDSTRRLARWGVVHGYDDAFVTARTPGLEKKVFKYLNRGISAGQHIVPALGDEFPFALTVVELEAEKGAALHAHETEEVFVPLDGFFDLCWGNEGEGQLRLAKHEMASMPTGLMRGFRNRNGGRFHFLVMVGGWNAQSVNSVAYRDASTFVPVEA